MKKITTIILSTILLSFLLSGCAGFNTSNAIGKSIGDGMGGAMNKAADNSGDFWNKTLDSLP